MPEPVHVHAPHELIEESADSYIFATVFFAGISMRFQWFAMRLTVLIMSAVFLTYGIIHIATLPTLERSYIALASCLPA